MPIESAIWYRPKYVLDISRETILVQPKERTLYLGTETLSILRIWLDCEVHGAYYILDSESKAVQPELIKVKYAEFIEWCTAIRSEIYW